MTADPTSPHPPGSCQRCGRPNETLRDLAGFDCLACRAEATDAPVILDHADVPEMAGQWSTGRCSVCGVALDRHLSFGVGVAARLGGSPFDFVRGPSPLRGVAS